MVLPLKAIIKYVLEGFAVAVATYLIAGKSTPLRDVALLSLTAGLTFMILDLFATDIGSGARQGTGFALGAKTVGFGSTTGTVGFPANTLFGPLNSLNPFEGFHDGCTENFEGGCQEDFQSDLNAVIDPSTGAVMDHIVTTPMTQNAANTLPVTLAPTPTPTQIVPADPQLVVQPESFEYSKGNCQTEIPYRFPNPNAERCQQRIAAHSFASTSMGPTKTKSRWMKWDQRGLPINANTNEYKIVPGIYAKYNLMPGYNEGVKPANQNKADLLPPVIWPTNNPLDRNYFRLRENFISDGEIMPPQVAYGAPDLNDPLLQIPTDLTAREGFESSQTVRLNGVVYSGDIINLLSTGNVLQRGLVNSQIIFDKPLPAIKTNLSKLRLVLAEGRHDPRKQVPIKYGDAIYIKHNANINNNNETRYIKYGERLQSHQDGPLFRVFKIFNKKDMKNTDYIKYGDEFLMAKGDMVGEGDKMYLKIEPDKSVSAEATVNNATTFSVSLERVYELFDRALCVCPKETLFP
jgi:hypothetical protein